MQKLTTLCRIKISVIVRDLKGGFVKGHHSEIGSEEILGLGLVTPTWVYSAMQMICLSLPVTVLK